MMQPRYSSRLNPVLVCALFVIIALQSTHPASGDDCDGAWSTDGIPDEISNTVNALALMPGDDGPRLVLGGIFAHMDGISAERIAIRDGDSWAQLGDGFNAAVHTLAVCEDEDGPTLYAGGEFTASGDQPLQYVAQWDGEAWQPLGDGFDDEVRALACMGNDDGYVLYAGGEFSNSGDETVIAFAQWDGEDWHKVGESGPSGNGARVWDIVIGSLDNDDEPAVYVGGLFTLSGFGSTKVARWNGTEWSGLGNANGVVRAVTIWDDGESATLFAGGSFTSIGGVDADFIAQWDEENWSPLGPGTGGTIWELAVHDDGTGPALYAGGNFTHIDGDWVGTVARWTGETWEGLILGAFGGGPSRAFQTIHDEHGHGLIIGSSATNFWPEGADYIVRWQRAGLPKFVEHPQSTEAAPGQTVVLTATLDDDRDVDFQWYRNDESLVDNGRISGSDTSQLTIDDLLPDDEGIYTLGATNTCGTVVSWDATLTISSVGAPADLNNDGVVDVFDLLILIGEWGDCPADGECIADINDDGVVDVFDLLLLIGAWGEV